jgi:hypothetical protein
MSSMFEKNTPYVTFADPTPPAPPRKPRRKALHVIVWIFCALVVLVTVSALLEPAGPTPPVVNGTYGAPASTATQNPAPTQDAKAAEKAAADAYADAVADAEALIPKAPKGVTVSGDYAEFLQVKSFKPIRNVFGWMDVDLRVKNLATEDIEYVSIKIVALRGDTVIATADGIIETINSDQTVTTSVTGTDDFPKNRKGITYELEME